MNEFCGLKGIKREFSVVRIPQQNRVAKRKNMTLIEATRTMLADSLLPTVFWAEAFNTACYVLNRVLVTKPHNKTPYELIIGRPPSISFMRPFGYPVTILNTLDSLGKFDGKAEEGFLVGYSVNSKAFRVFHSQTRKVDENLHVNFLENKPNVEGQGPNWLFDIDSLTNSMNYQPVTAGNQTNKNADETNEDDIDDDVASETPIQKPASENEQALKNVLDKIMDQEKEAKEQSDAVRKEFQAQFNTAGGSRIFSDAGSEPSFVPLGGSFPDDPLMPDLEDTAEVHNTGIFGSAYDDDDLDTYNSPYAAQVMGAEADFNNMELSTIVNPIPSTRVHSIHPKDQIIGDPRSAVQIRGMTKKKPTKIAQALDDESSVEAMQECWEIQARSNYHVAQGYKQEEGIDYDEVFAPVAGIKAIRLFLAYASFMNFLVYQMDVKSAFLYATIDDEVYVSQPPSFVDPEFPKKVYKVEKSLYGLHQAPRAWMSSMEELTFFLGLQVKHKEDGIFISQDKYVGEILKKFGFSSIRIASTPMETNKALIKDEMVLVLDRKSQQEVVNSWFKVLISWQCKIMMWWTNSATEACNILLLFPFTAVINTDNNVAELLTKALSLEYTIVLFGLSGMDYDCVERAITTAASLDAAQDRNGYRWLVTGTKTNMGCSCSSTRSERVEQPLKNLYQKVTHLEVGRAGWNINLN
ncbi:putative ribonuclease H-like domain-containing protein [Tanacetum coccineum]